MREIGSLDILSKEKLARLSAREMPGEEESMVTKTNYKVIC